MARVFDVALADLLADGVWAEELWAVPGRQGIDGQPGGEFPVWFFSVAGETIWGATARVLTELLCVVLAGARTGAPPPALNRARTGPDRRLDRDTAPVSRRYRGCRSVGAVSELPSPRRYVQLQPGSGGQFSG